MKESKLQSEIIKWLRHKGCYIIKTSPGPGTPVGCPDIIALYEGLWIAIECKKSPNSSYQPLQKETIDKLNIWSWCKSVNPSNWDNIKEELNNLI